MLMSGVPSWLRYAVLPILIAAAVAACGDDDNGTSSVANVGGAAQGGSGADANGGTSAEGGAGATGMGGGGGGAGPVDPGYPVFPETIGTVSVSIRTADVDFAGTDDGHLSLCLNATTCFPLDTLGTTANEFNRGDIDTFHFENVTLPRAAVDRIELRSSDGENQYRPACISVQFDGEAMHCSNTLNVLIGNNTGEVLSFSEPLGLKSGCNSCFPGPTALAPILGAVDESSAHLAVRTDATRRVTVLVAPAASPNSETVAAYTYPSPLDDYMSEVRLVGLTANSEYQYRFDVDGVGLSEPYSFRTAPAPGGHVSRIAIGSCVRGFPAPIFSHVVDSNPDLFIHLGDNHYANPNYAAQTSAERLAILRWHYRRGLLQPERAQISATIPSLAIWDDHDFLGDNTDNSDPGRADALQAFGEYWANSSLGAPNVAGTFSKESYGDVDIFLLDGRYYRDEPGPASGTMLGAAQTLWLEGELKKSTATFKLIVNGSLFSRAGESWKNYPVARDQLFNFLDLNQIQGVVILAGDIHRSVFRRVTRPFGYPLPELTSSGMQTTTGTGGVCTSDPDAEDIACFRASNYFMTLDIDTTKVDPELTATVVDTMGAVPPNGTWTIKRSELQ